MRIIYVYDALCGWCYGFSPVINRVYDEYSSSLTLDVISGGMITGKRVGPIKEVAAYIAGAYKTIEEKTGVRFGSAFLEKTLKDGEVVFDSFPPSKALKIFKELKQEKALEFSADIQNAIYRDGLDPNEAKVYAELAVHYGVSEKDFEILWSTVDYEVRTREDFMFAQQLKVTGYPTVFVEIENTYHVIARGYTSYTVLRDRLEHLVGFAELN